jgi:hypothetical protein
MTDVRQGVTDDPEVDAELKEILINAVDDDPDRRYPSILELRHALAAYLERIWPGRSWYDSC